jgi:cytoskeletal protein CcmA (bactofilin family)
MSQDIYNDINPNITDGTELANLLNGFKDAVVSGFSGATRPANLQAGGYWIDDTTDVLNWVYYFYDGTQDIPVFTLDINNGQANISGGGESLALTKVSDDQLPPELRFVKKRLGLGQTLTGDNLGELKFYGTDSGGVERLQANFEVTTTNDTSITQLGSYFRIEMADFNTGSLAEVLRLTNGEIGMGEISPEASIHIRRSDASIRLEREETSNAPATVTLHKKRLTNNGQVESGDTIGRVEGRTTDQNGAEYTVTTIDHVAQETHTDVAQGTDVVISTTGVGSTILTERGRFSDSGLEVSGDLTVSGNLTVPGVSSGDVTATKESDDAVSPRLATDKSRIAGNGQVLTNDGIGKVEFGSTDVDGDEFEGANIEAFAQEDHDNTNRGTEIRIQTIDSTTTALTTKVQIGDTSQINTDTTIDGSLTVTGNLQVDGTTTTVNSDVLDVVDANVTINKGGNQASADADDAGITVEMSDATDARIGYDSTLASKFKIGEVGSESEIVDADSAQTVSNKQFLSANIDAPDIDGGTIDTSIITDSAIVTPSRLDMKQDTFTNLQTYALTATNGQFVHATDTKQTFQIIDNALAPVGGGGVGSADTYYVETFEEVNSTGDLTTLFSLTGSGTLELDETTELNGDKSFKYTQAVGSLGDTIDSPSILLQEKQENRESKIRFVASYDGADDEVEVNINGLKINIKNGTKIYEGRFFATTGNINYQVLVNVENDGAILRLDDVEISTDNQLIRDLGFGDWTNGGTIQIDATTTAPTKGTTTEDFVFYAKRGDHYKFKYTYEQTTAGAAGSGDYLFSLPDGLEFSDDVKKVTSATGGLTDLSSASNSFGYATLLQVSTAGYGVILPYDSTRFRVMSVSLFVTTDPVSSSFFSLSSTNAYSFEFEAPIKNASSTEGVITSTEIPVNEYSGRVENNAGTVTLLSENVPGITASFVSTARVRLDYSSLNLTNPPVVVATPQNSTYEARVFSISNTQADIITTRFDGLQLNDDFDYIISLQGTDYKDLTANLIQTVPKVANIAHKVSGGSGGGSVAANTPTTCPLNELTGDTSFLKVESNQIVIGKGTYKIDVDKQVNSQLDSVDFWLRDADSNARILDGLTINFAASSGNGVFLRLQGVFTLNSPANLEIMVESNVTDNTDGLGVVNTTTSENVYTSGTITKLK